ncbi:Mitotic checkpoint protein BUB3.1 [Pseudocercospora fuligena]|uniref:Mitotic checkpoint protein BUB3.1 n=1 Tax=Pseudocercospora fuligena TaxID=685502 RepID=A0A8H6RN62_9PEZI|nr:Mitotic checkpoint protein BUB3.1 [Pseudocercospora fuligena]
MSVQELENPPTDIITAVRFSPDSHKLLVSAWDSSIRLFADNDDGSYTNWTTIPTASPTLDVCWGSDDHTFYAVGLTQHVTRYRFEQDSPNDKNPKISVDDSQLSTHGAASNKVVYSKEHNLVMSTSWDETMHVHDPDNGQYVAVKLAAKPFAIALSADKAVVSMVERRVHVYVLEDLKKLVEQVGDPSLTEKAPIEVKPWQERESSLKFQTRASGCMPDGTGFACSSIEGRVGVEWFDEEANKKMYAFKCHREKTTTKDEQDQDVPLDIIHCVNGLAFHPVHGTFATGGGDGVVALWDANTKRRIRQYPKLCSSVASLDFSSDGSKIAIGVSPGFEDSKVGDMPDPELVKIYVRSLGEGEAKGKPAKEK